MVAGMVVALQHMISVGRLRIGIEVSVGVLRFL